MPRSSRRITYMPSHLQINRYGVYRFRRRYPSELIDLIHSLGGKHKREFVVTLDTREPQKAKQMACLLAYRVERYLEYFRRELLKAQEDKSLMTEHVQTGMIFDLNEDGSGSINIQDTELIALTEAGLSADDINSIIQSSVDALSRAVGMPSTERQGNKRYPLLSDVIRGFQGDLARKKPKGWKPPANYQTYTRRLTEILGDDITVDQITRDKARLVFDMLSRMPGNTRPHRGKSVPQIVEAVGDIPDNERLSQKSLNDHMERYSALLNWAIREGKYDSGNPFDDLRKEKDQRLKDGRDLFTSEELLKIFSGKIFTDFSLPKHNKPHRYWMPLIALYSGARRAEIASLYLDDIQEINGIPCFDINENSDDKRLKTRNAARKVPIHSKLIQLGLLDYVDYLRKKGEKRLFPELEHWSEKEGYARPLGEWFNLQYLKQIGVYERRRKVFHSFRHTLSTALERADVRTMRIEQICGRSTAGTTTGEAVYIKDAELPHLHEDLEKVSFDKELENVKKFEMRI